MGEFNAQFLDSQTLLTPPGPLTSGFGWTLTDPSGIISSAPVAVGKRVTVGFNAIAGRAVLHRSASLLPLEFAYAMCEVQDADPAAPAAIFGLMYGLSSADGSEFGASGIYLETTGFNRGMNITATSTPGTSAVLGGRAAGMVVTPTPGLASGSDHLTMNVGVQRFDVAQQHDWSVVFAPTKELTDEAIVLYTNGGAAGTMIVDLLTGLMQPLRYNRP